MRRDIQNLQNLTNLLKKSCNKTIDGMLSLQNGLQAAIDIPTPSQKLYALSKQTPLNSHIESYKIITLNAAKPTS